MPSATKGLVLFCLTIILISIDAVPTNKTLIPKITRVKPPKPRYQGFMGTQSDIDDIAKQIENWKPEDDNNIWELSGLYQGDIMRDDDDHEKEDEEDKNGLLDQTHRWPDAIVPYDIEDDDFTPAQIKQIKEALETYHNKTCIRFRPYKKGDKDFVSVRGSSSGCWSYVGKHKQGQVVNFQTPGCLRHGTIVHEFMHALGFYHQQSAADRDKWVTIAWRNIQPGREHNFEKYGANVVTDYGVAYDYLSVMHYSSTAFSKNGMKTIVPKKENVTLGQRNGFSEKDIQKLNIMYKPLCEAREKKEQEQGTTEDFLSSLWPFSLIAN